MDNATARARYLKYKSLRGWPRLAFFAESALGGEQRNEFQGEIEDVFPESLAEHVCEAFFGTAS